MRVSFWDLQESLKHERNANAAIEASMQKWKDIIDDLSTDVSNLTTSGYEWKVRYESQRLYNRMLMKQLQRMRAEIRMLRFGQELSPFIQSNLTSVGDWKKHMRKLKVERLSMLSLRQMYDNQLDLESMAYYRARETLDQLTKDVKNTRLERIRAQEQIDCDVMTSFHLQPSPRRLKPVATVQPLVTPSSDRKKDGSYTSLYHARSKETGCSNS